MFIYILTKAYNDYDQHGEYFIKAYAKMPTTTQLSRSLNRDSFSYPSISRQSTKSEDMSHYCSHLLSDGGGRIRDEDEWYFLRRKKI